MPRLIVRYKQKTVQELELTTDRVIIGRGEESTIKLDDNLVSREHAEIREQNGKYFLSDLGSANGTYVAGKRITKDYELKDNDVIKISPYTIFFQLSPEEKPTQIGRAETSEKPTEIFAFSGAPRFLVRSGAEVGQIYDLSNNPLIGRDEQECDIVLSEPTVSRRHARIQFIENKLTIVDVGSKSGTRVNGKLIDRPTQLKDGDKVQLGEVLLEVDWKGAPRIEAEKPTVPFFRPEAVAVKKEAEWWKWGAGIAAAVTIIFAVLLLTGIRRETRTFEELKSDAQVLFNHGVKSSDLGKLEMALGKIDSALKKRPADEGAKELKTNIANKIIDINDASELAKKAEESYRRGDLKAAVEYAKLSLEKDPNNQEARRVKFDAHKSLAIGYELDGDKAKERGEFYKANDLYTHGLREWDEILALDAGNPDAKVKREDIKRKIRTVSPSPPVIPRPRVPALKSPYEKALEAYREGRLFEAKGMIPEILRSEPGKAKELNDWIETWEIAEYLLDRGDTAEALNKFEELIQKDPRNTLARSVIGRLKPVAKWNPEKAKGLFEEAERDFRYGIDYGDDPAIARAMAKYQEIVKMGPPPSGATPGEHNWYKTAKERLGR